MVITHARLTSYLHTYNCSRTSPENLIDWLVSHTNVQNTICYILFPVGGNQIQVPYSPFIVLSWAIFIAVTQTEQNSKALYSYLVQLSIAEQANS